MKNIVEAAKYVPEDFDWYILNGSNVSGKNQKRGNGRAINWNLTSGKPFGVLRTSLGSKNVGIINHTGFFRSGSTIEESIKNFWAGGIGWISAERFESLNKTKIKLSSLLKPLVKDKNNDKVKQVMTALKSYIGEEGKVLSNTSTGVTIKCYGLKTISPENIEDYDVYIDQVNLKSGYYVITVEF